MQFGSFDRLFVSPTSHKSLLTCFVIFLFSDLTLLKLLSRCNKVLWDISPQILHRRLDRHSRLRCLDCKHRKHSVCDQTKSFLSFNSLALNSLQCHNLCTQLHNTHHCTTHTTAQHTPLDNTHHWTTHTTGQHTPLDNTHHWTTHTTGQHTPLHNTHHCTTHTTAQHTLYS